MRLWTSLLDWKKHPAGELLALYAQRWEQESFYRELKVDMRSSPLVFRFTIIWEKVIVIVGEEWPGDYCNDLGGCGHGRL